MLFLTSKNFQINIFYWRSAILFAFCASSNPVIKFLVHPLLLSILFKINDATLYTWGDFNKIESNASVTVNTQIKLMNCLVNQSIQQQLNDTFYWYSLKNLLNIHQTWCVLTFQQDSHEVLNNCFLPTILQVPYYLDFLSFWSYVRYFITIHHYIRVPHMPLFSPH